MKSLSILFAGLAGVALAAESPDPGTIPKNLSSSDWSGIRAAYEAGRPAVQPQENGHLSASDPAATSPIGQQAYIKASNNTSHDLFGGSVAISGDTAIVGAYSEDSNATGVNGDQEDNSASESGAAYIFIRVKGIWTQQAYLKAGNAGEDDQFGFSVAISGSTVVIGAPGEDGDASGVDGGAMDHNGAGAAYVFTRNGTTWTQQAYLKASNTQHYQHFGWSVAISGESVVVGAVGEGSNATGVNGDQENTGASESGAAYVFTRRLGFWTQQAYLKASNTESADGFGKSVAISGDTVVTGALNESSDATGVNGEQGNNNRLSSGAAYVFTRSGKTWVQQAYLKASNAGSVDGFGDPVAISGDTLVIGAIGESSGAKGVNGDQTDNSVSHSGAAYVFTRSDGVWKQQAYLKASNPGPSDYFSNSLAISGDWLIVGAAGEDSDATGQNGDQENNNTNAAGAAYLFIRSGKTWTQQSYSKASNTGASDQFGRSVAISGKTVVIGANGERSNDSGIDGIQSNNFARDSGATYIFAEQGPEISVTQNRIRLVDGTSKTSFGTVKVGQSQTSKTYIIRNNGNMKLTGLKITKGGPHPQDFEITTLDDTILRPGETTAFSVTFKAKAKGTRSAVIQIQSDDWDENPFDIKLAGLGAEP